MNFCRDSDERFPSGIWKGYYTQPDTGDTRHPTQVNLQFFSGKIEGRGEDIVGRFEVEGGYRLDDGSCFWNKQYLGQHQLLYQGFGESGGIAGEWQFDRHWWGEFVLTYAG